MEKNNIWLVKFRKLRPICIAVLIVVIGAFYYHNFKRSDIIISYGPDVDACYKPMVKVDDIIYYDSGDVNNINTEEYEFIGEVKFLSVLGNNMPLTQKSKNFSSNWYSVGTKIYRYDDNSILVYIIGEGFSMLSRIP